MPTYSLAQARYPLCTANVETHTMGMSLHKYLAIKMHQALRERCYDRIAVVGVYARTKPAEIFQGEKTDKLFNWQRPTALVVGNELHIQCFPGYDHVEHYAELVATYLELRRQDGDLSLTPPERVCFIPSSCSDTQRALHSSNLKDMSDNVDTVVLGLVHRLERLTGDAEWQGGNGCFGWVVKRFNDRVVAFIGCRPSFWGDISGEIVHFLDSFHSVREVIYFGKLGSVKKGIRPNNHLATGSRSYVHGRLIEWQNAVESSIKHVAPEYTIFGDHVTLGSVLHETKDWLCSLPEDVDFVDPEVGMMAQAAVRSGIRFGYVHIILDNVAEKYTEDLSNERERSVLVGRSRLYDWVQDVLLHHLSSRVSKEPSVGTGLSEKHDTSVFDSVMVETVEA